MISLALRCFGLQIPNASEFENPCHTRIWWDSPKKHRFLMPCFYVPLEKSMFLQVFSMLQSLEELEEPHLDGGATVPLPPLPGWIKLHWRKQNNRFCFGGHLLQMSLLDLTSKGKFHHCSENPRWKVPLWKKLLSFRALMKVNLKDIAKGLLFLQPFWGRDYRRYPN